MIYHFERLAGGSLVAVSKDCRFTTDSVLLADFAGPARAELACDLCSGSGIVPALWLDWKAAPKRAYAVELFGEHTALIEITVAQNLWERRLAPVRADLRSPLSGLMKGRFDLVTCNPPYGDPARENAGGGDLRRAARQELTASIGEVCAAAKGLLRFGGRFCLCQRPARLAGVLEAMRSHRLEPKRLRFVHKNETKPPWLFLLEGRLGGGDGLTVEPPLFLEREGAPSPEYGRIYRKGEA